MMAIFAVAEQKYIHRLEQQNSMSFQQELAQ